MLYFSLLRADKKGASPLLTRDRDAGYLNPTHLGSKNTKHQTCFSRSKTPHIILLRH